MGSKSVGAAFQVGGTFGVGLCGGIQKTSLISLTSEEGRTPEERYQAVSGWLKRSTSPPAQRFWRALEMGQTVRIRFPPAASLRTIGTAVHDLAFREKPRVFMPYVGGVTAYKKKRDEVAANGYQGFHFGASFEEQAAAN
jgi:hypothetical protein